ncbi:MAG: hypothetical protein LBQ86_01655 [Holophagales bacterium]|jgi:hypothetical protein|nr:hypothetical protein [Holophagales bacterium]
MTYKTILPALFALSTVLSAQTPDTRPGEGLAVISQVGEVKTWGEVDAFSPLGNLAKILWLRLESDEWNALGLRNKCKGELNGIRCSNPKGHGRVDLPKSFREDCNVSFSLWVNLSRERLKKDLGDGGARLRLNEIFGPFLGDRLPKAPLLPPKFGTEWFADGRLLQASPAQLAQWLAKPAQERLLRACRNYMLGFMDFAFDNNDKWWVKTAEAPTVEIPATMETSTLGDGQKQVWVMGGNSTTIAILRLPPGVTPKDAQTRFRALLNIRK